MDRIDKRTAAEQLADARLALGAQVKLIDQQSEDIAAAEAAAFLRGVDHAKSTLSSWARVEDVTRAVLDAQRNLIARMARADCNRTSCLTTKDWLQHLATRIDALGGM